MQPLDIIGRRARFHRQILLGSADWMILC